MSKFVRLCCSLLFGFPIQCLSGNEIQFHNASSWQNAVSTCHLAGGSLYTLNLKTESLSDEIKAAQKLMNSTEDFWVGLYFTYEEEDKDNRRNGEICFAVQFRRGLRIAETTISIFKQKHVDCFEELRSLCLMGKENQIKVSQNTTNVFNTDCKLWNPSTEPNLQNRGSDTFTFDGPKSLSRLDLNYWADVNPRLLTRTIPVEGTVLSCGYLSPSGKSLHYTKCEEKKGFYCSLEDKKDAGLSTGSLAAIIGSVTLVIVASVGIATWYFLKSKKRILIWNMQYSFNKFTRGCREKCDVVGSAVTRRIALIPCRSRHFDKETTVEGDVYFNNEHSVTSKGNDPEVRTDTIKNGKGVAVLPLGVVTSKENLEEQLQKSISLEEEYAVVCVSTKSKNTEMQGEEDNIVENKKDTYCGYDTTTSVSPAFEEVHNVYGIGNEEIYDVTTNVRQLQNPSSETYNHLETNVETQLNTKPASSPKSVETYAEELCK